jgi:hypothetical protein
MQEHADKCPACSSTLRLWRQVLELARNETSVTPPDDVIHLVKAQLLAASTPEKERLRLVFDSILHPSIAGVRGSPSGRQLLFETDEYYIDLRLESRAGRTRLVGQILSRRDDKRAADSTTIQLLSEKVPVASTTVNSSGEFQLEFDAKPALSVLIIGGESEAILLPLD